ncbi:hypothetical protein PPL_02727 [Heterostelium album PN500]|uniref:EGF-like domain-containing protein n=1 Tax=Heterostelium pallidum (strain ATCC 26659 / Pp 5 / PN500) TaxID=670386 RepID=D3B2W3_HETP5|nr:hypothetical protein PPL_02727 [Heterostelium album PN500]EFA83661.1 hypothetical protein PPL_02727 [Heterostelium album PN500]|eukprot:XP_020435778.1 hypothetical protein PPL_02727 [Heterostelium album PN500]
MKLFYLIFIIFIFKCVNSICPSNFYYNSNDSVCLGRTSGIKTLYFSECLYSGYSVYFIDQTSINEVSSTSSNFWKNPLNVFGVDLNQEHSSSYCPALSKPLNGMRSFADISDIEIVKNKYLVYSQCASATRSKIGIKSTNNPDEKVESACIFASQSTTIEKTPPFSNVIELSKPCLSTYVCGGSSSIYSEFQTLVNSECNDIFFNCSKYNTDKETFTLLYNQTFYIGTPTNFSSTCPDLCLHGKCNSKGQCDCYDLFAGPTCNRCADGYEFKNNQCVDINECSNTTICNSENSVCANTVGSYTCQCKLGYVPKDSFTCIDEDECKTQKPCGNGTCINSYGGYRCDCPDGFKFMNQQCVDIDECTTIPNICPNYYSCVNTIGSFNCFCPPENLKYCQEIGKRSCNNIVLKKANILTCQVNPDFLDSENVIIVINGVKKIVAKFKAPYINSTTRVPTSGGIVSLNVSGIHDFDNTWVLIDSKNCTNLTVINENYLQCLISLGTGSHSISLVSLGQFSTDNQSFYYLPPSINETSTITQSGGLLTIYGDNFGNITSDISIFIGSNSCSNISLITPHKSLSCWVAANNFYKDILYVSVSNQRSDDFILFIDPSYDCDNTTCYNNGFCNSGICFCNENWTGPYCNISSNNIDTNVSLSLSDYSPHTQIITESLSTFNLNIKEIREMSASKSIVQRYDLNKMSWTMVSLSKEQWVYNLTMPNLANLTVDIEFSNETKHFNFGDQQLRKSKGSLKYTISIDHWPFSNRSNHLELILTSDAIQRDINDKCYSSSLLYTKFGFNNKFNPRPTTNVATNDDQRSEVLWFKTYTGWSTLFAKFFNKAILDGKMKSIRFASIKNNDSPSVDIALIIPYFKRTCIVDPDYSVLVNANPPTPKCSNVSDDNVVLAASLAILAVFAVASISSIAFYIIRVRKRSNIPNIDGATKSP